MQTSCHVTVVNRLLPTAGKSGPNRSCWSNVTIKEVKLEGRSVLQLTVISSKNKQGVTYRVTDNIENVFAKFVSQGKLTVRFREPQHDLQLNGDAKSLTDLFRALRGEKEYLKTSSIANNSNKLLSLPKTKLIITTKAEYPITTSFPHTLRILKINNLCLKRFDRRILQLKQLEQLDLSHNQISEVPESLSSLRSLNHLNLSHNKIKCLPRGFCQTLPGLGFFDLSNNEIQVLPSEITHLKKLHTLKLNSNQLAVLPKNISRLAKLRVLNIAMNRLRVLPASLERLSLDDIDTHDNPFEFSEQRGALNWKPRTLSLRALAGSSVIFHRIPYGPGDLPRELIAYLEQSSYCPCGSVVCDEDSPKLSAFVNLMHVSASVTGHNIVPIELTVCSLKCFDRYAYRVS